MKKQKKSAPTKRDIKPDPITANEFEKALEKTSRKVSLPDKEKSGANSPK